MSTHDIVTFFKKCSVQVVEQIEQFTSLLSLFKCCPELLEIGRQVGHFKTSFEGSVDDFERRRSSERCRRWSIVANPVRQLTLDLTLAAPRSRSIGKSPLEKWADFASINVRSVHLTVKPTCNFDVQIGIDFSKVGRNELH